MISQRRIDVNESNGIEVLMPNECLLVTQGANSKMGC